MKARLALALAVLAASPALASEHISFNFHGPLKKALHEIADKGEINLVIKGNLEEPAELLLKDVTPEEALQSLADAYHLQLDHKGKVWTVVAAAAPAAPAPPAAAAPPAPPTPAEAPEEPEEPDEAEESEPAADVTAKVDIPSAGKKKHLKIHLRHHHHGNDYSVMGSGDIAEGTTVGDAVAMGGNLAVHGTVEGDAVAVGGNLDVFGTVNGSANAIGGTVHVHPDATIAGDVSAVGGSIISDEGCNIEGDRHQLAKGAVGQSLSRVVQGLEEDDSEPDDAHPAAVSARASTSTVLGFLVRFALLFSLGFLFMIFAPNRMKQLEQEIQGNPLRCGLTGFVGVFAIVGLTLILTITLVGIPFVVLLYLVLAVGLAMGFSAVASDIGMRLPFFRGRKTQALVLAVGLALMLLAGLIPVVGPIALTLTGLIALGAIIRTRFGGGRRQGLPEQIPTAVGT